MRALVTGATGFLGSRLARRLIERGDDVRVLVRPTSDLRRLEGLAVAVHHGDVVDRPSLAPATAGVDVVFHCAALVEFGPADRGRLHAVNVEGTRHVLHAAVEAGAVAVHVSSVSALGSTGPDPVDETHWSPIPPLVEYERTKREAHLLARELAGTGAPVRIGIPGGIYGHGDESSMATLIETFVRFPTPVGYLPELRQSLVQVDDCADALILIAERGMNGGEYLLCADAVPFRQWFEAIARGAGRRPPSIYVPTSTVRRASRLVAAGVGRAGGNAELLRETVDIATRHQAFSGGKARAELGWQPRNLTQGMAEMCTAIRLDGERRRVARRRAR